MNDLFCLKGAHVPMEIGFSTKPQITSVTIERDLAAKMPFRRFAADSVLGVGTPETALHRAGERHVLDVNENSRHHCVVMLATRSEPLRERLTLRESVRLFPNRSPFRSFPRRREPSAKRQTKSVESLHARRSVLGGRGGGGLRPALLRWSPACAGKSGVARDA